VNLRLIMVLPSVPAAFPSRSGDQLVSGTAALPDNTITAIAPRTSPIYVRPSQKTMLPDYALDGIGPYPIAASAFTVGLNQFVYSGSHSLFTRMHLNDSHDVPDPGPNH